ncbi:MAG: aryl-sulfate sulfotransferase [Candidatus Sumerlaeota bacterium]|nr:aryl-sulfate sulfotransferase [Candidatus Sumerlaeota bacterium]
MNGTAVRQWKMDGGRKKGSAQRARLQPSGRMLVLRTTGNLRDDCEEEHNWDGRLVWEYAPPGDLWLHHNVEKTTTGNVLIIFHESVPDAIRRQAKEPERREALHSDVIQEVSPDGMVVWEWHQYEHLDINPHRDDSGPPGESLALCQRRPFQPRQLVICAPWM